MGSKSHKKKKTKAASVNKKALPKNTRKIYEASTTDNEYTTSDAEDKEWAVDKIVDQAYDCSGRRRWVALTMNFTR